MDCKITHIAPGIIRLRKDEKYEQTLAERYSILKLPNTLSDSGMEIGDAKITLPNGRELYYSILDTNEDEFNNLYNSLCDEFSKHYNEAQKIIGTPDEANTDLNAEIGVSQSSGYAIEFSIDDDEKFYGLGEGNRTSVELRGNAYQNWARYQYDEIAIPFMVSSKGWGIFINCGKRSFVDIDNREKNSIICLGEHEALDIFVLSGNDIADVIKKYTFLTGAPVMLPKWAYGLTYIAPLFANQEEVLNHAERFRKEHIPCDMFSLEPGWMEKFYDYSTEKKWAVSRFHIVPEWNKPTSHAEPYRKSFIAALKRFNYHLSLWLCVRYDLTGEAERTYVGGDAKDYPEAWYEHLKCPTDFGVDGYKLDPADMLCCFDGMKRPNCFNGLTAMEMHNYNQVLLPKQMYEGFTTQTGLRPMLHYCGGFTGIQRWCGSTTGDNGGDLGAMIWLETLALSGHSNTTIDMDIHSPESIHFGMFVPWAHFNAWDGAQAPWWCGEKQHRMFVEYARLRYRILPYFYSAALEAHEDSCPMVRAMPLAFPNEKICADISTQYMIGNELLVVAYAKEAYLPSGEWINAWNGNKVVGPCKVCVNYPKTRGGGLFIRGGAIIPSWHDRDYISQYDETEVNLDIYPHGKSFYVFREDDGVSLDCESNLSCHTLIEVEEDENAVNITIGERNGDYNGKPIKRIWNIRVHCNKNKPVYLHCHHKDDAVLQNIGIVELFQVNAEDIFKV